MTCPCGLTRSELVKLELVSSQRCTALYEDKNGAENVCGKLYTSHPISLAGLDMKVFEKSPSSKKAKVEPNYQTEKNVQHPTQTELAESVLRSFNSPDRAVELWHIVCCELDPTQNKLAEVPLLQTNIPPCPRPAAPYTMNHIERDFPLTSPELGIFNVKKLLDKDADPKYSLDVDTTIGSTRDETKRPPTGDAYVCETFKSRREANEYLWRTFSDAQVLSRYASIGVGMQGFTGCLKIEGILKECPSGEITCWWVENPYLAWNAANMIRRMQAGVSIKYVYDESVPVSPFSDTLHLAQEPEFVICDQRTHTLTKMLVEVALLGTSDSTAAHTSSTFSSLTSLPAIATTTFASPASRPDSTAIRVTDKPLRPQTAHSFSPTGGAAPSLSSKVGDISETKSNPPQGIDQIVMSDMAFNLVETVLGVLFKLSEQTHLHRSRSAFEVALSEFNLDAGAKIRFTEITDCAGPVDVTQTIALVDDAVTEPGVESPLLCGFLDILISRGITLLSSEVSSVKRKISSPLDEPVTPMRRPKSSMQGTSNVFVPAQIILTKNDALYMTRRRTFEQYQNNSYPCRNVLRGSADITASAKATFSTTDIPPLAPSLFNPRLPSPPGVGSSAHAIVITVEDEMERRRNKETAAFLSTLTERDIGFLRDTCKDMNLPTNGRKDALLHRIKGAVMMGAHYKR